MTQQNTNQKNEVDDYQADIRFGEWLRSSRIKTGLSVDDAAKASALTPERLKSLELGFAERGITRQEATRLSVTYKLQLAELLERAEQA